MNIVFSSCVNSQSFPIRCLAWDFTKCFCDDVGAASKPKGNIYGEYVPNKNIYRDNKCSFQCRNKLSSANIGELLREVHGIENLDANDVSRAEIEELYIITNVNMQNSLTHVMHNSTTLPAISSIGQSTFNGANAEFKNFLTSF